MTYFFFHLASFLSLLVVYFLRKKLNCRATLEISLFHPLLLTKLDKFVTNKKNNSCLFTKWKFFFAYRNISIKGNQNKVFFFSFSILCRYHFWSSFDVDFCICYEFLCHFSFWSRNLFFLQTDTAHTLSACLLAKGSSRPKKSALTFVYKWKACKYVNKLQHSNIFSFVKLNRVFSMPSETWLKMVLTHWPAAIMYSRSIAIF